MLRVAALLVALWTTVAAVAAVEKERAEVPQPAPVSAAGVRYQAPLFTRSQGLPQNGGYVEAVDEVTGQRRWIVKVVRARTDDGKEQDKRDVFITELKLTPDGKRLLVTDERGQSYRLDLRTRRVTRLKASRLR